MKIRTIYFFALFLFIFSRGSLATEGEELLSACKATLTHITGGKQSDPKESGLCIGLLNGVYDRIKLESNLPLEQGVCLPEQEITLGQGVRMLIEFLENNKAKTNEERAVLVYQAFAEKYPCKN